ncbi:R3H-associated N-terminal domain-domain-containing protein [Aspergillus welwitschiae]|uniref:R3H-associated N-terminal domain-domain-containing protein n=1 Tax=Aspergillus welwitschiae TaxID=1341132 RepID=A0A3F3PK97_9EURO|nr:R3H-associated N-terminal domain-domain-containing protein [Aspergillus welwitschiae]RDH27132.1 R3H-associated N-terminal domain-domain-containing protein [Aspergillus welwitschiae]
MAIHPNFPSEVNPRGSLSPQQARAISVWTEQAAASLESLTLSESVPIADSNVAFAQSTPTRAGVRGTTVSLSIPLDDPVPTAGSPSAPKVKVLGQPTKETQVASVTFRRREPIRRDSLKRREALLKGKDGSRRRQRWENDRLLNNPWAEPPSSKDWDIQATHTRHDPLPYYLAPLWDNHYAHLDHRSSQQMETRTEKHRVPKELRQRLKHARAARGILQDIEEDIRQFIQRWNEKQSLLKQEGLADAPQSSDSESEDEIVFVGRNGLMHDSPQRRARLQKMREAMSAHHEHDGQKMVFESLVDDRAAGFGRWLVHSIASYYGLHTWSVTVGEPARREAYVGFYPPAPSSRAGPISPPAGSKACRQEAMIQPGDELPQPLWMQLALGITNLCNLLSPFQAHLLTMWYACYVGDVNDVSGCDCDVVVGPIVPGLDGLNDATMHQAVTERRICLVLLMLVLQQQITPNLGCMYGARDWVSSPTSVHLSDCGMSNHLRFFLWRRTSEGKGTDRAPLGRPHRCGGRQGEKPEIGFVFEFLGGKKTTQNPPEPGIHLPTSSPPKAASSHMEIPGDLDVARLIGLPEGGDTRERQSMGDYSFGPIRRGDPSRFHGIDLIDVVDLTIGIFQAFYLCFSFLLVSGDKVVGHSPFSVRSAMNISQSTPRAKYQHQSGNVHIWESRRISWTHWRKRKKTYREMPLQGKDAHGLSSQLKSLGSSTTVSQGPKGKAVGRILADHSARLTWKNCVSLGSADSGGQRGYCQHHQHSIIRTISVGEEEVKQSETFSRR